MPTKIYKRSPEQIKQLIKNITPFQFKKGHKAIGKPFQNGHKVNLGKKKKPHTEETKRKISESEKGRIAWNKGLKNWRPYYQHLDETKEKISNANMGEKNANWRGGKSFEPYSVNWTETLKKSIRKRDNYICQKCSQYGNTVHHIDYNKKNCNPNNLITLCGKCNTKVNKNRSYWTNYFNEKQRIKTSFQ